MGQYYPDKEMIRVRYANDIETLSHEVGHHLEKNGYRISYVDINLDGKIDMEHLKSLINDDTVLVSICEVNSEIGIIQNVNEIGEYLKKFPKIGEKVAHQIILDLKGKLNLKVEDSCKELIETLKVLGYKNQDINGVIKRVDKEKPLEEQIKDSLKLLLK